MKYHGWYRKKLPTKNGEVDLYILKSSREVMKEVFRNDPKIIISVRLINENIKWLFPDYEGYYVVGYQEIKPNRWGEIRNPRYELDKSKGLFYSKDFEKAHRRAQDLIDFINIAGELPEGMLEGEEDV